MCMGYAKEIRAWVCEEAGSQRENMMNAWGQAFEDLDADPTPPASSVDVYLLQGAIA